MPTERVQRVVPGVLSAPNARPCSDSLAAKLNLYDDGGDDDGEPDVSKPVGSGDAISLLSPSPSPSSGRLALSFARMCTPRVG